MQNLENKVNNIEEGFLKRNLRKASRYIKNLAYATVVGASIFLGSGNVEASLTYTQLTFESSNERQPAVSPDGSKIAFVSNRDGNSEIYLMNADGTGQTRLTFTEAIDRYPCWSPDGQKIAFASSTRTDFFVPDTYIMNVDGSNIIRLTYFGSGTSTRGTAFPSWSPDGQKIAFSTTDIAGPSMLYIYSIDLNTSELELLISGGEHPSWSPDGTEFVYSEIIGEDFEPRNLYKSDLYGNKQFLFNRGLNTDWGYNNQISFTTSTGPGEIYMMNADGSNITRLTYDSAIDWFPSWFPDGGSIAFQSNRSGNYDIWVMSGIPEPTTLLLAGAGLVGLLAYINKRRKE